jgi:hypothetical protein
MARRSRLGHLDRLCHDHLTYLRRSVATDYLGAKGEQLVPVRDHGGTIHRSQAGHAVHSIRDRICQLTVRVPGNVLLGQFG